MTKNETVNVSKQELEQLCDRILTSWVEEVQGGRNAYLECKYCKQENTVYWNGNPKDIRHALNCDYLIAQGIKDSLR
jgi:hypothetical protein